MNRALSVVVINFVLVGAGLKLHAQTDFFEGRSAFFVFFLWLAVNFFAWIALSIMNAEDNTPEDRGE